MKQQPICAEYEYFIAVYILFQWEVKPDGFLEEIGSFHLKWMKLG